MTDWTLIAGGRCQQPWHVEVAGFDTSTQRIFHLSEDDWGILARQMPLEPLVSYGQGNGLLFGRLTEARLAGCDGLLLIAFEYRGQTVINPAPDLRRYLVLQHGAERNYLKNEAIFAKLFLPAILPFYDEQLIYLNSHIVTDQSCVNFEEWSIAQDAGDSDYSRFYSRSADFWIHRITSAIAADASVVQKSKLPLISIVIPTYNYGRFLKQCIQSVLDQEVDDIEILVLDNASTDETSKVMEIFKENKCIRYIRNRYNYGPGFNWRNGLWIAQGRYFTFLSADDYFNSGHLARLLSVLENHPQVAVGYTSIRWVNDKGQPLNQPRHPGYRSSDYIGKRNEVADLLIYDCYMTPSAVIYRREEFCKTWHPSKTYGAGDWEMVVQMAEQYPDFAYINTPGVSYRWHGKQESTRFYATLEPLKAHLAIVDGVFERKAQHYLKQRENEVIAHIKRRLALYSTEQTLSLIDHVNDIIRRLEVLAESNQLPLFSVVVTTYNRLNLLKDTLNSIGEQEFRDFEVILVNDHGDPVEHCLNNYLFPITYLRQSCNRGPAAARNIAHTLAVGQYIVYLDDDDVFLPNHLRTLADAILNHPGEVVYTDAIFVLERIEDDVRCSLREERRYLHDMYSRDRLFVDNYIPVNTFAWPRAVSSEVGGFDECLPGLEDWDFLLRLASKLNFHHIQKETVQVRLRVDTSDRRSQQAIKDYLSIYKEIYSRNQSYSSNADINNGRKQMLARLGGEYFSNSKIRDWLLDRQVSSVQSSLIEKRFSDYFGGPSIAVIVLADEKDEKGLIATINSFYEQSYKNALIEVLICSDDPDKNETGTLIQKVPYVKVSEDNFVITLNDLVSNLDCDWYFLVRAGEVFTVNGLMMCALELINCSELRAVYMDLLLRSDDGEMEVILRPDFNLDLLLSFPSSMATHWLVRKSVFLNSDGYDPTVRDALEFDFLLRLLEVGGMAGLGHVSEPLLIKDSLQNLQTEHEIKTLQRHLALRGYEQAVISPSAGQGCYHIRYSHAAQPLVSIIVPMCDQLALTQRCVMSVLECTQYSNYELLIVDNSSVDPATLKWLAGIEQMNVEHIRVLKAAEPMTRSALLNQAAQCAKGDYLLLLSPECAAVRPEWLDELLNHAQRPEVGIVGSKMISADGVITHAGQILGLRGVVGRAFFGEPIDAVGYMNRLQVDQNYSAVSGDCLMVRRSIYFDLGGLDEGVFAKNGAEIDLCLRVIKADYLIVWTPHAVLLNSSDYKPEPVALQDAFYARWLPLLARDPAYNPNFSLVQAGGFKLTDNQISWRPLMSWRPLPVVLAHQADLMGCGHYRVMQPFGALKEEGLIDGMLSIGLMHVTDLERYDPDVIVLQRQIGEDRLEAMRRMKAFSRAFKVYELDDYLPNLPVKSIHRQHMPKDIVKSLRRGLTYVDRFVVSTDILAEAFSGLHSEIHVAYNRLDPRWWGDLTSIRRRTDKPRVGWAGGAGHTGDLEMVADVIEALSKEVDWIFLGMCPEKLRPFIKEYHPGVAIDQYPRKLAQLDLDLAIAPVEQNLFNECKSNLRLLEYGVCGFPVICSDIRCYEGDLPVTRVKNRFRDWMEAIRSHINDLDAAAKRGDALQHAVKRDWMLEGQNVQHWKAAWLP